MLTGVAERISWCFDVCVPTMTPRPGFPLSFSHSKDKNRPTELHMQRPTTMKILRLATKWPTTSVVFTKGGLMPKGVFSLANPRPMHVSSAFLRCTGQIERITIKS
jgi:hypothetical protein